MKNKKIIFNIFIFIFLFFIFSDNVYAEGTVNCTNNKCSCYYKRKVDGDSHTQYEVTHQQGFQGVAVYNNTGTKEFTNFEFNWANFAIHGQKCNDLYLKTYHTSSGDTVSFGMLNNTDDFRWCTSPSGKKDCEFIVFESFNPKTGETTDTPVEGELFTKECVVTNCRKWNPSTRSLDQLTTNAKIKLKEDGVSEFYIGNTRHSVDEVKYIDNAWGGSLVLTGSACGEYLIYSDIYIYFHKKQFGLLDMRDNIYDNAVFCGNFTDQYIMDEFADEIEELPQGAIPGVITPGTALDCGALKTTSTYKIIKQVFTLIQIIAPIMLIIFGVLDFGKAVAAGEADAMKKSQSAFVKRLIIAAIIILLPVIMNIFVSLLEGIMSGNVAACI